MIEKINAKTKFVQLIIKLPNVPILEPNDMIDINDIIGKININVEFIICKYFNELGWN